MNRFILLLIVFCSGSILFAQSGAVTNAFLNHKEGILDKAKQEIDQAVVHEKTKGESKTWYYKGIIYMDIFKSENPAYKSLSPEPLKESISAFEKSKELDPSKGEFYKYSDSKLKELWAELINKGINDYDSEKAQEAKNWFEIAQKINPNDTTAYIYGSYAAESLNDDESLRKYSMQLVSLNYKSPYLYRNRIVLESDPVKKLEIAKQAQSDFPMDESLTEILGDTYFEQKKYQDALNTYQTLNARMPENTVILTKIAMQYEKLKEQDKALSLYEKIIKLNNINFIAQYNSSIIYYEKGKVMYDQIHKLNVNEYHIKGKQMEDEMNTLFDKSIAHANLAFNQTNDEGDKNNINLIIAEIKKITKK